MAANSFRFPVSDGHNTVIVDFTLHPIIRSSNFQVLVQDAQGNFDQTHTPAVQRTYLGRIQATPGAVAAGLVTADGRLLCRISFESGVEWAYAGFGNATVLTSKTDWKPRPPKDADAIVGAGGAGSRVFGAELGVDVSYNYYVATGASVAATLEMVEFSVMAANMPFLRDAAIRHQLGKVVVRTSSARDPYHSEQDVRILPITLREEWMHVLPVGITHHLAVVVQPTPRPTQVYGWSGGQIGTTFSYALVGAQPNGDFCVLVRIAAGSIWGAIYQEDEGPSVMRGTSSRFSSAEVSQILVHRASNIHSLQDLGAYSFPLPPRANMDSLIFLQQQQAVKNTMQLHVNVLANDSDSNGHALSLSRLPASSALGGRLTVSPTAPDEIIYTPPPHLPSGMDYFSYQIADATQSTATGYITVELLPDPDLVAHWPLDEGEGTIANDISPSHNNATITGSATWVSGHIGGAISLDGTTGQVIAGSLNITATNSITITGWVRCNGTQAHIAGLAMCRDRNEEIDGDSTSAGLHLAGPSNELRYHWGTPGSPSYHFSSGLTLRDAMWTFVALVVSPTQVTLYTQEGEAMGHGLESANSTGTFQPQSFRGAFVLGNDAMFSGRHFKGAMDDFRVFGRALTRPEIALLASHEGPRSNLNTRVRSPAATVFGYSFDFNYTSDPAIPIEMCSICPPA